MMKNKGLNLQGGIVPNDSSDLPLETFVAINITVLAVLPPHGVKPEVKVCLQYLLGFSAADGNRTAV